MITEARRLYMRNYQNAWRKQRRLQWIREHGPCAKCGSTRALEVDHVDPATKEYEVAAIWGLSIEKRQAELSKCQVLCHKCHAKKTALERAASGLYEKMRIVAPAGMAWCWVKKHFAPVTEFTKDAAKRSGLQSECMVCRANLRSS